MRGPEKTLIVLVVLGALLLSAACGPDEPPAPVEEPVPSPIVGTWELDAEALVDSYVRMAVRELEAGIADGSLAPEAHQSLLDQSRRHAAENFGSLHVTFVFKDDGTYESQGTNGGSKGTWAWERGALTLVVLEQGGSALRAPTPLPGVYRDDIILIQPEADKDYAMTLRRVISPAEE